MHWLTGNNDTLPCGYLLHLNQWKTLFQITPTLVIKNMDMVVSNFAIPLHELFLAVRVNWEIPPYTQDEMYVLYK